MASKRNIKRPVGRPTKRYVVISPRGKKQTVEHLGKFCNRYKLNVSAMYRVAAARSEGQRKDHNGWVCKHA